MKRNRIISALFAFFLVLSLIVMPAQPVYAVKANEVGISVSKPKRSYNNETGKYCMEITIKNNGYYVAYVSAHLYNADGKRVTRWDNDGNCFCVYPGGEKTLKFAANYSKYSSSSYTFVYQVKSKTYYNSDKGVYEDPVFKWKWNITSQEACGPSITFKKATLRTLDDGSVVPRINYTCKNMKGQTVKVSIYDEYGDLVYQTKGKARPSNNENNWISWNGKADGQQYPDGDYTVKIVSSGGVSVSKKFYFDFPYNNR